jgi:hypothetical protein
MFILYFCKQQAYLKHLDYVSRKQQSIRDHIEAVYCYFPIVANCSGISCFGRIFWLELWLGFGRKLWLSHNGRVCDIDVFSILYFGGVCFCTPHDCAFDWRLVSIITLPCLLHSC